MKIIRQFVNNQPTKAIDMMILNLELLQRFFLSFENELVNPITNQVFDFKKFLNTKHEFTNEIQSQNFDMVTQRAQEILKYEPLTSTEHHQAFNFSNWDYEGLKPFLNPETNYGNLPYEILDGMYFCTDQDWTTRTKKKELVNQHTFRDEEEFFVQNVINNLYLKHYGYESNQSFRELVNDTKYQDLVFKGIVGSYSEFEFLNKMWNYRDINVNKPILSNYLNEKDLMTLVKNFQIPSNFWNYLDEEMKSFRFLYPDIFNAYNIISRGYERNPELFFKPTMYQTNNERISFYLQNLKSTLKNPNVLLDYLRNSDHNIIWFEEYDYNNSKLENEIKYFKMMDKSRKEDYEIRK